MSAVEFDPMLSDTLNLVSLERGMTGMTARVGAYYAEAAVVCLEERDHHSGVALQIDGDCKHRVHIRWDNQGNSDQQRRAWNDEQEATEQGACGIAALLVHELTEYTIVERARKGQGFDYWLGRKGSKSSLFQEAARLEVSGIRKGDGRTVESRVRQKTEQIKPSDGALPGVVIVVEFGSPRARVKTK